MENIREFYKILDKKSKTERMTFEQRKLIAIFLLMPLDTYYKSGDEKDKLLKEFHKGLFEMAFNILIKRMGMHFNAKISYGAVALFASITKNNPGKLVMYMIYLGIWARDNKINSIDLSVVLRKIFPDGFFSDESLSQVWDLQKTSKEGSDNLLDHTSFYKN